MDLRAAFPYKTPRAFEAALTARLKTLSASSAFSVSQLRRQFAYDRLLARCFTADIEERWILKGGISMLARLPYARHSTDVDLMASCDDLNAVLAEFNTAIAIDLGDLFRFELGQAQRLVQSITGVRVPIKAAIGRRDFEAFRVDLVASVPPTGIAEIVPPIVTIEIPGLIRPPVSNLPSRGHCR